MLSSLIASLLVCVSSFQVVSTFLALIFVDRVGRRHFLLMGISLMTISIFTLGISTLALDPRTFITDVCNHTTGADMYNISMVTNNVTMTPVTVVTATSLVAKWLAFICLMLYVLAYAFSFGPGTT